MTTKVQFLTLLSDFKLFACRVQVFYYFLSPEPDTYCAEWVLTEPFICDAMMVYLAFSKISAFQRYPCRQIMQVQEGQKYPLMGFYSLNSGTQQVLICWAM